MIKTFIKKTNNGQPLPKIEKTKFQLDKEGVAIRNKLVATREKSARLLLAKAREDLVDKDLIIKQATFLFVAMRQKMLAAPLSYYRRFLHVEDPHVAIERLTTMQHDLLRELKDMPKKITDPNWMETLDEED
jgi:hypothetical protein